MYQNKINQALVAFTAQSPTMLAIKTDHGMKNMSITPRKLTILYSHGSKDPRWKDEMETLTAAAKELSNDVFTAYMELCSPSLEEILLNQEKDSVSSIDLLPIFLATGKHLKVDIPAQIAELQGKYGIEINLLPPVGHHPLLAEAIKEITTGHLTTK